MKKLAFLFLLCLSWPVLLWASEPLDKMQASYEKIVSFKTTFYQVLTNAASKEQELRKGKIYFKKPELILWEVEEPEPEKLLVNPQGVWDYFPEENTAYKYPKDKLFSSKTMLKFISGKANLKEDFVPEFMGKEKDGLKFKLVPKNPEPNLVLAFIWIDEKKSILNRILLVDFFGNGNELSLTNTEINVPLDDKLFSLDLPKEVEVIENNS